MRRNKRAFQWKDRRPNTHDVSAAFDSTEEPFHGVCRVDFGSMLPWEVHVGEYIVLGVIDYLGELGHFGAQFIGGLAPPLTRGLRGLLRECGSDEGGRDSPALLAGMWCSYRRGPRRTSPIGGAPGSS